MCVKGRKCRQTRFGGIKGGTNDEVRAVRVPMDDGERTKGSTAERGFVGC
jgi:hypothetical protein